MSVIYGEDYLLNKVNQVDGLNLEFHSSKDHDGQEVGEEAVGDISDEFGKLVISAV